MQTRAMNDNHRTAFQPDTLYLEVTTQNRHLSFCFPDVSSKATERATSFAARSLVSYVNLHRPPKPLETTSMVSQYGQISIIALYDTSTTGDSLLYLPFERG
jgi:hypothetical protein